MNRENLAEFFLQFFHILPSHRATFASPPPSNIRNDAPDPFPTHTHQNSEQVTPDRFILNIQRIKHGSACYTVTMEDLPEEEHEEIRRNAPGQRTG